MALEEAIARFNYQYVHSSCKTHICDNDCDKCIEARHELIEEADKYKWIPVTARPERLEYAWSEDITHIFTCKLPDDGDEILISQNNGKWVSATVFCNDDYGVGDEHGNDWLYEVDAWMPMPKGYIKSEV